MKSTFYFLVKPLKNQKFSRIGKFGLVLSASIEDHKSTQRFAEVVGLPGEYSGDVSVGDVIVVHHNTFRDYYDMKGVMRDSAYKIKDDLYYVEVDRIYMHIKNEEEKVFGPYAFVSPVNRSEDGYQSSYRAEKELIGKVALINDRFSQEENVNVGDLVTFTRDSEYEFRINEERYYRVPTKNIVAVL